MTSESKKIEINLKEEQLLKTETIATTQQLCFLIPCLNESENIHVLYSKLTEVRNDIYKRFDIESKVLFIDDGSTDNTWDLITKLNKKDPSVNGIKLSRNFGKENALLAGYENAPKSDFYLSLDADMQDDPSVVGRMVEQSQKGYHIVFAQRASRLDSWFYVTCTKIFYAIMRLGTKVKFPPNVSDFHIITEKVRQSFLQMQESVRYTRGLVFYTGYSSIGVSYDRPDRNAGESKFNFMKLVVFMLDAVTSFTTLPVHLIGVIGMVFSIFSFIFGLFYVAISVFTKSAIPGWASMMSASLFLGSVQIMMTAVLAEYISRISQEVKHRPKYFLDEVIK